MNCEICGKPTVEHTTELLGRVMTKSGRCEDHRDGGVLRDRAAAEFVAFVRTNRRMPSIDELRAMGVFGLLLPFPGDPEFAPMLSVLEQVVESLVRSGL